VHDIITGWMTPWTKEWLMERMGDSSMNEWRNWLWIFRLMCDGFITWEIGSHNGDYDEYHFQRRDTAYKLLDVSENCTASIFRIKEHVEQVTNKLHSTISWLRQLTPSTRDFLIRICKCSPLKVLSRPLQLFYHSLDVRLTNNSLLMYR
jgi:hypothetical protein